MNLKRATSTGAKSSTTKLIKASNVTRNEDKSIYVQNVVGGIE
jgi:hypothetical protein